MMPIDPQDPFCVDYRYLAASYKVDTRIAAAFEETTQSRKTILNRIEHLYHTHELDEFISAATVIQDMIRVEGLTDFDYLSEEDLTDIAFSIAFLEGLAVQMVMGKVGADILDEHLGPLADLGIGGPTEDVPTSQIWEDRN